jgi:hypothetical protein
VRLLQSSRHTRSRPYFWNGTVGVGWKSCSFWLLTPSDRSLQCSARSGHFHFRSRDFICWPSRALGRLGYFEYFVGYGVMEVGLHRGLRPSWATLFGLDDPLRIYCEYCDNGDDVVKLLSCASCSFVKQSRCSLSNRALNCQCENVVPWGNGHSREWVGIQNLV